MRPLPLALLPALLLAACAGGNAPMGGQARAVRDACTVEAERVVRYRDRGQLMRQDDYNARVGTTSELGPQVITDQIAQLYDRDRMAADCVRGVNAAPAAAPIPAATAEPAPAETTPPRTTTRRRGGTTGR